MILSKLQENSGLYKTAIIILSLNDELAAEVLSMMKEEEVQEISKMMASIGPIKTSDSTKIIMDFKKKISQNAYLSGDVDTTRRVLKKFLDSESIDHILSGINSETENLWVRLSMINEELFSSYLKEEHPQTIAVILSKLTPEYTAKVISFFPEEFTVNIITRIINLSSVKKEVLDGIENTLRKEFITSFGKRAMKNDSYQLVAEVFNSMDSNSEDVYLSMLDKTAPDVAERVRNLMFTFEDLTHLTKESVQVLINNIDKRILTLSMKGASESIKSLIFSNISQRAAKIIQYELETMGAVRVKEVSKAQAEVLTKAKTLMAEGKIEVVSSKEEYIS